MPTSFSLTLFDSDFTSSARLRLRLPSGPVNAPAFRCDRRATVLPSVSDRPLTCTCLALQRTSCHDFVTTSWRHIAARASVHITADPPFRFFPTPSSPPPSLLSDLLSPSLRGAALKASRCSSPTRLHWPRRTLRRCQTIWPPLLGPGPPFRSPDPLGVPPSLGPGARGDVMLVFPCRLVVGDVSVIHPAAASFAGGATRIPGFTAVARDASKRRASAGVLRPALRANVSRVLRAPWGPGPDTARRLV
jgi:hypothetical protein